jgi:hypothetical protein
VIWCCATPERAAKSRRVMEAFAQGCGGRVIETLPPDDGAPVVLWGQRWLIERAMPAVLRSGRDFWLIDNGFHLASRNGLPGYHRVTYRGLAPALLPDADRCRLPVTFSAWRESGGHIVIALPGEYFGRAFGLNMPRWSRAIHARVHALTRRAIVVRDKSAGYPIARDLRGAWALVTHSSNAAIDAALAGVPVFCEPTCAAAPVGNLALADLEQPATPAREGWWASLMAQQFTQDEMRSGLAWAMLQRVKEIHGP